MHNITSVIWKRHPALTNPTDPEVKAEEGGGERQGFSQNPAFHEKKKKKKEKGKRGRQSSGISTGMAAKER